MFQFFLAIIFFVLTILVGYSVLKPSQLKTDNLIASLIIGIPALSFIVFLLSFLLPLKPIYIFWIVVIISLCSLKKNITKIKINISSTKINWISVLSIILSLMLITFYTYKQSYNSTNGLTFYSVPNTHDSLWHAALQNSLQISIPPENPVFSQTILRGYHYFTDIYFSLFSTITQINTIDLAIRFIPLIIGLIFVLSNYLLAKAIFKKPISISLATILLSIYSSQPYLFYKLFPKATIHPSMFWLDQPATYLINPQLVISISILNLLLYFYLKKKSNSLRHIFLLASLVGIKIYALIAFLPTFFINLFQNKKPLKRYLYPVITLIFILGTVLLIGSNSKQLPFFLSPGWFIKQMFTNSDHLNQDTWELKRLHYITTGGVGATLHLIKHWTYGLVIFLAGNFGLILLPFIFSIFKNKKRINLLLLPMIIASILFPLLFLQSGVVWNTIQVLAYARIPIIISLLYWLKQKSFNFSFATMTILIILSLPTIYLTYQSFLTPDSYQNFSPKMINSIKNISFEKSNSYVVTDSKINDMALIPAISSIPLYAADSTVLTILSLETTQRLEAINNDIKNSCPGNFVYLDYKDDQIIVSECTETISLE
ncbi:MAG: hypothetical protein HN981_03270 [Candidatus Pacebacteria bacterium]|nr:hypothetical protein [Candidatus Paceibacterota bacterium]MBT4652127.1 hypothetical protein [Candidatus Paceibacterota bacterium]MBT6756558.1 hypothetical protein [Candidatus Paceibacterota bacterium]MBT6921383.1 hypothetical protein [Candidatus Paceibacterota bacterium]